MRITQSEMLVRAGGVALAVALVGVLVSAASGAGSLREFAFVRGEGSATDIYVVREDGRGLRRLTRSPGADYSPIWSPDGRRILFVSSRDGDDELFVMDAAGRDVRQLTQNRGQDVTPQWSPDGGLIAFASDRARAGEPEIWIMRSDGTGARRLVKTVNHPNWQGFQYSPVWAPDGKRLIFSMAAAPSNPELYVVGVNGKGLERLTKTRGGVDVFGDDTMPDWSDDGASVVFVSNREQASSDIWTMNADGSAQKAVARRPGADDWNPRVSHNGRTIAFTERVLPGGQPFVCLMKSDGSAVKRLIAGAEPDWKPR
jgi:TolB protein